MQPASCVHPSPSVLHVELRKDFCIQTCFLSSAGIIGPVRGTQPVLWLAVLVQGGPCLPVHRALHIIRPS